VTGEVTLRTELTAYINSLVNVEEKSSGFWSSKTYNIHGSDLGDVVDLKKTLQDTLKVSVVR